MRKAERKTKRKNGSSDPKAKLEAVLLLLKMKRQVGLYHIQAQPDGLRLNVNRG